LLDKPSCANYQPAAQPRRYAVLLMRRRPAHDIVV
jgi:hypothetical protein